MERRKSKVEITRERYPKGTEVALGSMRDEPQMPGGLKGVVEFVDDACQVGPNGRGYKLRKQFTRAHAR